MPILQPSRESNQGIVAFAESHGASIQLSQMTEEDLKELQEHGCEALIVASYKWRIGDWTPYLRYAVNFHASPLPEARGPYPGPRAILEKRLSWAVTCHKVTEKLDRGDILATQHFPLSTEECHESLDLKTQIAARRLATSVAANFADLWATARPQGPGTYWHKEKKIDRAINFNQNVDDIMRHVRAYGLLETLAHVNDKWLSVRRAVAWEDVSRIQPGTVVHTNNRTIVVAARNGFVGLIEWDFASEETIAELQT